MKLAPTPTRKKPVTGRVKEDTFPVVAIGASAGGLEAITQLLQNLPVNTGMAFIYVQHLSPDHKSFLTTLLSKLTLMKVQEVKNKMFLQPNNLYIIPPDKEMVAVDGHLKLTPRTKGRAISLPIDTYFCSLAEKHREGIIGIILSGSGSDGTRGLNAIKQAGGLTFAQDDSAKFGGMPKSAITAGAVDFVLSPKEIALELGRLNNSKNGRRTGLRAGNEDQIENSNAYLKSILNTLNAETGVDFSHYKMTTIKRRIIRRMLLCKINTIKEYAALIAGKKDEVRILYQDLLINVTGFFRDSDAHNYLKSTLFPRLLKSKGPGESLRIWVPACSTGEEVYSIAMMLVEIQTANRTTIPVQIFATDLSAPVISKARAGEYSKNELDCVSPKRLQRFYTKAGSHYRISKLVRDLCVFAPHNILRDPPFSRIDFVSCCNLLIYLDNEAKKRVISTLHFALNPNGYLMLGKSESIDSSGKFTQINSKSKIYSRNKHSGQGIMPDVTHRFGHTHTDSNVSGNFQKTPLIHENGFDKAIDAILLARYVPASVVINYAMDILLFRGATDLYLRHSTGKASLSILKMASPEIALELRHAISKSIKTREIVRKAGIEIKQHAVARIINIEVVPLTIESDEPLLLILFSEPEQVETIVQPGKGGKDHSLAKDRQIEKLKKELLGVRADMHSFAQEQETFNEELQNANEEVVSSNEELQSVNEELETSKEEIESTNEELITTNQELQTRNDLLNESYDFSEAIISTIHEPIVVLDGDLRVKSANHSFYETFHVTEEDTERTLLYDLGNKQWNIPRLRELLEDIIPKNSHFHDFEVTHTFPGVGEKIMLLNASRLVQKTHGEQLILLAINDITERAQQQLKEKELLKKERTKDLAAANARLEEKNSELQKMNAELESFTYVSSHDLQEPLRKIQAFSNRILETENQRLSEKGKEYFSRVQTAANRMQKLIDDLLAFSRLNVAERIFEKTDLKKIIEEVKIELKDMIDEKHATIETSGLCDLDLIPFQFRQLMYNLINNALKFSKSGLSPHIIIKSIMAKGSELKEKKLQPEKEYCHIMVTDNGIGFDTQYKERIFEVFQRLHGKHEYAGTGIGLAIVKKVVENHNGFITVTSKLNKGATFNVYLPV